MKKRTCNNCKAFDSHGKCMLGFYNDNGVPKEECPKPQSWKQYIRYERDNMIRIMNPSEGGSDRL